MDQLIFASLSHTHYWYEVGMLKVPDPVGESLAGIPWKLNPPVFSGNSVNFRSFKKEAIIFAEYVGFGHVRKDTREIQGGTDPSISYAQLGSHDFTHDDSRVSCIFKSTQHRTLLTINSFRR